MTQPVNRSLASMRPPSDDQDDEWCEPNRTDIEWEWSFKGITSSTTVKLAVAAVVLVIVATGLLIVAAIMATGAGAQPATTTVTTTVAVDHADSTLPQFPAATGVTRDSRPAIVEEMNDSISVRERTFTIPPLWMPLVGAILSISLTSLTTRFDARPITKGVIALAWAGVTACIQNIIAHQGSFQLGALGDIFFVTVTMTLIGYFQIAQPAKLPEKNIFFPRAGLN